MGWREELERDGRVVVPSARGRLALLLVVSLAFVAVGVWMAASGEGMSSVAIGWASILFFGLLGVPAIGWQLLHPWEVVVTREGVEVPRSFSVPWRDVVEVGIVRVQRTDLVVLRVRDEAARRRAMRGTGVRARMAGALAPMSDRLTGGVDLTLPSPLRADPRALAAWLDASATR